MLFSNTLNFLSMQKGDILLSVNGTSLCGLTHSQAVATLKATINLDQVVLGIMDGPETSFGASNFVPSWMYWQKIPRSLQYPKTVILHRKECASWGFSIVGGADPGSGRPMEPIHVLFVVPDSPAAKDGKLKYVFWTLQVLTLLCFSKLLGYISQSNKVKVSKSCCSHGKALGQTFAQLVWKVFLL